MPGQRRSTVAMSAERRYLLAQSWYRPDVAVARDPDAGITTGAIAAPQPATQWSVASYRRQLNVTGHQTTQAQRTALGGPQRTHMAVGPFASRAEAERMRHELEGLGPVAVGGDQRGRRAVLSRARRSARRCRRGGGSAANGRARRGRPQRCGRRGRQVGVRH